MLTQVARFAAGALSKPANYNSRMHVHGAQSPRTQRILRLSLAATLVYVLVTFVAGMRAH